MNKEAFLNSKKINAAYYPVYCILAVCVVALFLPIGSAKGGVLMLGCIFGGLYFWIAAAKATASNKNLAYLQQNGYYEQMCKEYPGEIEGDYIFTDTFAFSNNRNLCLPVSRVQALKPTVAKYINNASKSKIELTVFMDNGEKYCFLLKTGKITHEREMLLVNCVAIFMEKNPAIVLKRS